ncbi:MAG: thiolase domain-containing protein [bacterium]
MREAAIVGIGMTDFGELWGSSLRQMFTEAATAAIEDAGVDHIESMYVGSMSPGLFVHQEHIGALLADYLGVAGIPAGRVESACASGGLALRQAVLEVLSGVSEVVLAGGVEKMTDGVDATDALATAADQEYEAFGGITFPGLYALMARAHMEKHGTTREQMADVAVKNHANGALNPRAQFRRPIERADVLTSTLVADPLRLLDCSPITDGAAAAVVTTVERARELGGPLIRVRASTMATDSLALHDRPDLTSIPSVGRAVKRAFQDADLTLDDIDVLEVHDCFTIAELVVMEEIGLVEPGSSGQEVTAGLTARDGKLPINTSGGLKSKGHPVGASGIAQVFEIVEQLRGSAGERQIEGARIGMAQNMGGSGASCVVHILEAIS